MEKVTTAKIKAPSRAIPSDPTEVYDGTDPRSQLDEAQSSHLAPMISKPRILTTSSRRTVMVTWYSSRRFSSRQCQPGKTTSRLSRRVRGGCRAPEGRCCRLTGARSSLTDFAKQVVGIPDPLR